ncbi:MAG: PTS sugar transporter subunit IIC [Candidatus Methanomethylophilaceae archaeon]|nr:PTS sugar transporter subunit IIC [Candidatus Methanomethylophilaceae archaeon]
MSTLNEDQKEILGKVKEFLIKTTNGMAIGLFGTLIIGTILSVVSDVPGLGPVNDFATLIKGLMGAGIGLGVALSLKTDGVKTVTLMAAGMAGTMMFSFGSWSFYTASDPLSAYICTVLVYLAMTKLKETSMDLVIVPLFGLLTALVYCFLLGDAVHQVTLFIGWIIESSFDIAPLPMCVIVCVLVGMALTAPISSVAICVAIQIGNVPLAAGAAVIGCCVQMLGFALQTAYDNKLGSVIAVGIGTSMLQFKNILRKPVIWLPTIITSAILSPFAYIFDFASDSVGAGMGTSGLVGLIDTFKVMEYDPLAMGEVVLVCVILALAVVFVVDRIFRRAGLISKGDFALEQKI